MKGIVWWRHLAGKFDQSQRSSQHSTRDGKQQQQHHSNQSVATMHKCTTCGREFTRHGDLVRHSSRCRPKPFVCTVCNSSFGRKQELERHKITVQCGSPPQPGPASKRQKVTHLHQDPVSPPPPVEQLDDELSSDLQDAVRDNWGSIRTYVAQ